MINFSGIPERSGDWTWFKAYIAEKRLGVQYEEDDTIYRIYGYDPPEVVTCKIWKGTLPPSVINSGYSQAQNDADKADFEANYKDAANQATSKRSADGTLQFSKQNLQLGRKPLQRTDNGTEQMAVDGIEQGAPVVLWNGTGVDDTGGDWTHDLQGTETAASMHSGTNGMDSGVMVIGDRVRFDYGSNTDIDGSYDSLQFWIQPKAYPVDSKTRIFWEKSDNTDIGAKLQLHNYVSDMDLDVWQQVSIPIEDFGLTEDVAKLNFRCNTADGQQIWYDDIELVASSGGGPYKYRVSAPTGYVYHVEKLILMMVAPDTGWTSSSFAHITAGLNRGLLVRYRKIGEETYWKVNCKNNIELFGQFEVVNDISYSNGNRQFTFALKPELSSVVLVDDDEVIDVVVRDDLSDIVNMRAFLHYGVEILP